MLQIFSLHNLSSDRLLNYANVFLALLKESEFKNEYLPIITAKIEGSLAEFEDAQLMAERALLTKQIAAADRQQDISYLILRSKIEAAKWESIDEEKSDAGLLIEAINDIGFSLHSFSYVRQESALHHLLNSFENDSQLKTAVNNLNFQDQVKDLSDKFEEFKRLRKMRRDERKASADEKSLQQIKRELIGHIKQATSLIDIAFNTIPENASLKALVGDINKLNASERSLIKGAESRKSGDSENSVELADGAADQE